MSYNNDNELQSVWMVDRDTFIQQFNLKVDSLERSLKDILAESLPEWGLDGKIHKLIVQMELKASPQGSDGQGKL